MVYKIPNKLLRYGKFMALDYLILQILTITVLLVLSIVEQSIKKFKLKIKNIKGTKRFILKMTYYLSLSLSLSQELSYQPISWPRYLQSVVSWLFQSSNSF